VVGIGKSSNRFTRWWFGRYPCRNANLIEPVHLFHHYFASTTQWSNMLDPSYLALNHCDYSHIEVRNDPAQHLMGNSPDLPSNILEPINSLVIGDISGECSAKGV